MRKKKCQHRKDSDLCHFLRKPVENKNSTSNTINY